MTCLTAILLALVMALGGCAVGALIFDKEYTIDPDKAVASSGKPIEEVGHVAFAGNHALFYAECMLTVSHLRSYDVDFGIISNPKYNKEQPHYSSMMHSISGMVSVPRSVTEDDLGMISSMLDMILADRVCDLVYYYRWGGNAFDSIAKCLLPGNSRGVASRSQTYKSTIDKNIDKLIRIMDMNDQN